MIRRTCIALTLTGLALTISGCRHNHATNPIANVDSKQPDKVLFDRAIDALKKGKYDTTRITLQTLINTYPDSEYIARAKLAIGDSWYEEGTAASLQQAERVVNGPAAAPGGGREPDVRHKVTLPP